MIIMNSHSRVCKTTILLFALFLIPSLCFGAKVVSVKKDNVNVRSGPGTEFPVAMELFKGYPLKVVQKKGDWLKVTDFEKDSGWIYSSLVKPGSTVIVNGKKSIVGMMLESNLGWGTQKVSEDLSKLVYGVSITDACIDWGTTEEAIRKAARELR